MVDLSTIASYFALENKGSLTKKEIEESRREFFLGIKDEFIVTDDGTLSLKFQDTMHSYIGALKERFHAYTIPSNIILRKRLLDICSGFSYNALYALNNNNNLEIDMVEKIWEISAITLLIPLPDSYSFLNPSFDRIKGSIEHKLSDMGLIKNTLYENDPNIRLHIGDAETILSNINEKFDVIFFDPYKSEVSPELFTIEFVKLVADRLEENGVFLTYLSNYAIRSAISCYLNIGKVELPLKKVEGTIASKLAEDLPLNQYEERIIALTELGIPYRKAKTPEDILQNRLNERKSMKNKFLLPSSKRDIVNFEDAFFGGNISLKKRLEDFGLSKESIEYITCPQIKECICKKCEKRYASSSERIREMRKRLFKIKGFNSEAYPCTH
ncbi:MAG TPA: MnmC family methyltransferase [Methanofastidiosum sp.]|nr:MnmC family methyltransferase [Methanofastidiosum sp.]HQF89701.1 MnmC family methyltransferase [Methanofastidiosum sp.]HQG61577.1 MnmC family methyltransferase [Methanofastidiosum sp.]